MTLLFENAILPRMTDLMIERFALKLAKYTICRLVQSLSTITASDPGFEAGSDWQEQIRYQIGLTMSPDDGVFVRFEMR